MHLNLMSILLLRTTQKMYLCMFQNKQIITPNMIKITLPDQSVREYEAGVTGYEIAQSISPRLAKEVLSITVNDQLWRSEEHTLNSSHVRISYAVFCLKKKKKQNTLLNRL